MVSLPFRQDSLYRTFLCVLDFLDFFKKENVLLYKIITFNCHRKCLNNVSQVEWIACGVFFSFFFYTLNRRVKIGCCIYECKQTFMNMSIFKYHQCHRETKISN